MKLLISIFLWATVFSAHSVNARQKPSNMERVYQDLTTYFHKQAKNNDVAGSSLAVVRDGELIFHQTYGVANVISKKPIDKNTIFHWASITKTITGIAIMQLQERGLLSLDDPVTKYIPELRQVHNEYGSMDEITIRHLMSHSAGFRNPTWPWGGFKDWHPHEPQHWEQLVAMFPYTDIQFKPGTKWIYSNLGIIFLGRIIELTTQDDYEYYIHKNILTPLKMYRSYFDGAPYHLKSDLAHSYYLQENGSYKEARFDLNTGITVSNGGLNAPVDDMMKYINFLLGNAHADAYKFVLKKSSLEKMFSPQIAISSDGSDAPENAGGQQMGLSFFVGELNQTKLIGHSGNQNGFISHIYLAPEYNTGYAIVFNSTNNSRKVDRNILSYLLEKEFLYYPDSN
ncbi:serine hydrolase domain-containing protein [Gracilimonas sp.]|uniref:serine hydrolase domain-containing protein n=1 Tax=Gracilimonas sp. TaxID=1974203 RepID=UPI0032EDD753